MGRALEPGVKQFIVLKSDAGKENPPKIYFPALSIRKSSRIGQLMDEFATAPNSKRLHEMIVDALSEVIIGWEGMKDAATGNEIAFSKDAIWDVFTIPEAYEIMQSVLQAASVSADDQKKSE